MGITQYKVGKSWEQEIMEKYSKQGYCTFKLPTDIAGTVFDIIAIRNNKAVCIEAKHTNTDKLGFTSSGLEHKRDELDNFREKGNNEVLIYIKSEKLGQFVIPWDSARLMFKAKGYLDLEKDCICLEKVTKDENKYKQCNNNRKSDRRNSPLLQR